tara:strand:+ start:928 stop:1383 length:456 start_codon:yes stop_codon:yes gene_type:complete
MGNFLHDFVSGAEHLDITAVEQALAIKFPEDLVAFWNKHQGGWPENDIFNYTDMYGVANDGQVMSFLLLNKQEGEMVRQTLSLRKEGRVLDCHVVIADEAGGHKILYNSDDGKIYVWDHENEDVMPKNCYPVGNNFTHFFNDVLHKLEMDD